MKISCLFMISMLVIFLCIVNEQKANAEVKDPTNTEFYDVSDLISSLEFENIKNCILLNGDKENYGQMYNNNPHMLKDGIHYYLDPEIGQGNIDCDPNVSDFNTIVIRDTSKMPQYYILQIVRQGDLSKPLVHTFAGMQEGKIYLINYYNDNMNELKANLTDYIPKLKSLKSASSLGLTDNKRFASIISNPVYDLLKVNFIDAPKSIEVVNLNGSMFKTISYISNTNSIDINVSQMPAGLYVCKLKYATKEINLKFIKL